MAKKKVDVDIPKKKKFEERKQRLTPMNPIQTRRAMKCVEQLYEGGDPGVFTDEWRQGQIAHILECSKLWGEK